MALPESATRNWKTKALGSALLIGAVASAVIALLDDDPVTNPDWQAIIAAAAGIGIFVSRSESQHRKDKVVMLLAGLCLIPLLLLGCTSPNSDRGSLGETISAVNIQYQPAGQAPALPGVAINDQGLWYEPLVRAVNDANADGVISAEEAEAIASLTPSRATVWINSGNVTLTISGTASAASAGETTQTATGPDVDASVPVNVTPGSGATIGE